MTNQAMVFNYWKMGRASICCSDVIVHFKPSKCIRVNILIKKQWDCAKI